MGDYLDREIDWNKILDAFGQKLAVLEKNNQMTNTSPFIIKSMLSFKLANIGVDDEFW